MNYVFGVLILYALIVSFSLLVGIMERFSLRRVKSAKCHHRPTSLYLVRGGKK